jgi:hypothetical protein
MTSRVVNSQGNIFSPQTSGVKDLLEVFVVVDEISSCALPSPVCVAINDCGIESGGNLAMDNVHHVRTRSQWLSQRLVWFSSDRTTITPQAG